MVTVPLYVLICFILRNDPFEFHGDDSPSLSIQSSQQSSIDNVETENPLPIAKNSRSTVTNALHDSSCSQKTYNNGHDDSRRVSSSVTTPINNLSSNLSRYFTSPSSLFTSQALNNLRHSYEKSPYLQLKHVTMVTATNRYVRTEVIDQHTGHVIGTQVSSTHIHAHVRLVRIHCIIIILGKYVN